jgi:hypothetical protein
LIVPATFILLGIGALIGAAGIGFCLHTPARLPAHSLATGPRSNSRFGLGRNWLLPGPFHGIPSC